MPGDQPSLFGAVKFVKPCKTSTEHIALMKSRGLEFGDEAFAVHWLENTGYFRLTGYGLHFRERDKDDKLTENFVKGTRFEDLVALYEFDRHLRLLILDAVERFEVAFRTRLNNTMAAKHGPHWFMDDALFSKKTDDDGRLLFDHAEFLEAAKKHQQTPFIKKYLATYTDPPYPPCWMLAETITFGTWSRAYGMLIGNQDQKPVSDAFRLSVNEMTSFSQAITDLRNKCAHQSRVWDHRFVSVPRKKGTLSKVVTDNSRLYAQTAALIYCLWTVEPENGWLDRLENLIAQYPVVKIALMGFPPDWKEKLLSLRDVATGSSQGDKTAPKQGTA
jgi:abortive infection bacteriophage resistance protein